MLAAIFDRGNTWILNIMDNNDVSIDDLKREWSKRYIAWFVNGDGSREVLLGMPITRFILATASNELVEINREKAIQLLDMLEQLRINRESRGVGMKK